MHRIARLFWPNGPLVFCWSSLALISAYFVDIVSSADVLPILENYLSRSRKVCSQNDI